MLEMWIASCPRHEFHETNQCVHISRQWLEFVMKCKIQILSNSRQNIGRTFFCVFKTLGDKVLGSQFSKLVLQF